MILLLGFLRLKSRFHWFEFICSFCCVPMSCLRFDFRILSNFILLICLFLQFLHLFAHWYQNTRRLYTFYFFSFTLVLNSYFSSKIILIWLLNSVISLFCSLLLTWYHIYCISHLWCIFYDGAHCRLVVLLHCYHCLYCKVSHVNFHFLL